MSFKVPGRLLTDGQCRMMINGIQFIHPQSKKLVVLAAREATADALRVRCWEDNSFCIQSKVLLDGICTVAPQVGTQDSCLLHGRLLKEQNAAAFDMSDIETITEAE